ncbi:hypothetical protein PP410_gp55 [Vibrio phage NF]|uniref:Uncharacterized protein n=1 Tax=Vibrio phage NF TaxID=2686202 RepID=A0A6B9J036_9CAUD|nr:hypothetical protein PP410_gp55 [Vibrio phage NF]QGZ13272.1 hypothetical protein [Vibrio phage NF]
MESRHIIKYEYENGKKLRRSKRVIWCGVDAGKLGFDFVFQDAQHALLSIEQGQLVRPCKNCLKEIKRLIDSDI